MLAIFVGCQNMNACIILSYADASNKIALNEIAKQQIVT